MCPKAPEPRRAWRGVATYCNRSHLSEAIQNMIEVQQQQNHQHEVLLNHQHQKQMDQHHVQHRPLPEQPLQQAKPQQQFIYHAPATRPARIPFRNPASVDGNTTSSTNTNNRSSPSMRSDGHSSGHSSAANPTTRHSTHMVQAGHHVLNKHPASQDSPQSHPQGTHPAANRASRLQPEPLPVSWSQPAGVFECGLSTDPALLLSALRTHILSNGPAALIVPWEMLRDITDVLLLLGDDITFAAPGHSMVITPLVYSQQHHVHQSQEQQQHSQQQHMNPSHEQQQQQRHKQRACSPERVRYATGDDAIFHTDILPQQAATFVLVVSTCQTEELKAAALSPPPARLDPALHLPSPDPSPCNSETATNVPQLSACSVPLTHLGSFDTLLQDGRAAGIDRLLDGVVCRGEATLELQCRYDAGSIREALQVLADTGTLLRNTQALRIQAAGPEGVANHPRLADIAELLRCGTGGGACMQACTQHGNLVMQPEVLLRRCADGRRRGALFFSLHIVRSV